MPWNTRGLQGLRRTGSRCPRGKMSRVSSSREASGKRCSPCSSWQSPQLDNSLPTFAQFLTQLSAVSTSARSSSSATRSTNGTKNKPGTITARLLKTTSSWSSQSHLPVLEILPRNIKMCRQISHLCKHTSLNAIQMTIMTQQAKTRE